MTRSYIGLSCTGHDNALAIVDASGEIVFAEASERYLQNKRALDNPPDDMMRIGALIREHCPSDAELVPCLTWSANGSALIAGYRDELERAIYSLATRSATSSAYTRAAADFVIARQRSMQQLADMHLSAKQAAGRNLRYRFPDRTLPLRSYEHHETHAATACYTSPFEAALCVVVDGLGEGTATSCYRYERGALSPVAAPSALAERELASLGMFYADLCTLCGFEHWKGEEWKVMGLAAYGDDDPQLLALLKACIDSDGLSFRRGAGELGSYARLLQMVAREAEPRRLIASIARAGQRVFEGALFELCRRARELVPSDNLVLTGGCALNSSANGKLLEASGFKELYVPSAPGDDGNAVGAALLGYLEDHATERPAPAFQTPYLGSTIDRGTLERAARAGCFKRVERLPRSALCAVVAERLAAGDIVGWMQGRAELGPRALGNRSILADPRRPEMQGKLNEAVKYREGFRPFAPAILHEHGEAWFESYQESPYMERTLRWTRDAAAKVPAVVHVDGTGRLQTVKQAWNPLFHELVSTFWQRTGVPLLLNTSFNVMGKPIVHSVEDAIAVFATSGLHVLVIEDFAFFKT